MREYCLKLQRLVAKGTSEVDIQTEVDRMMEEVYTWDTNHFVSP